MKVNLHPKEGLLFNAFLLIFVIHEVQTGIGLIGLPRVVYLESKHDAWISVLLAGIVTGVVLWFMILMLNQYDSADLYGIHVDVMGKYLGNALNIIYMIYLCVSFFVILMNYIEIVQVWIFQDLKTWQISMVLVLLVVYAVLGGIRVIVGISFLALVGTFWLVFILAVPIHYSNFSNLLPIMNTNLNHLVRGMYGCTLSMMGFELLMFLYPFIKEKDKVMLYTQIGNAYTTLIFTITTLVSITFFAESSLARTTWPVLSMFKIVRLPNLERFEFIAVSFWMLIILPNMCTYLWAASKGFSRVMKKKQKLGIWMIALMVWAGTFFFHTRYQVNQMTDLVAKVGFFAAFCYPVLLSIMVMVKKRLARRKKMNAKVF